MHALDLEVAEPEDEPHFAVRPDGRLQVVPNVGTRAGAVRPDRDRDGPGTLADRRYATVVLGHVVSAAPCVGDQPFASPCLACHRLCLLGLPASRSFRVSLIIFLRSITLITHFSNMSVALFFISLWLNVYINSCFSCLLHSGFTKLNFYFIIRKS